MSPEIALVELLLVGIAIYLAIAILMHTMKPVALSAKGAPESMHNRLAVGLRPWEWATSCVCDREEQNWTWKQYAVAALLLVLVSVVVMALLLAGVYMWTLLQAGRELWFAR